MENLNANQAEAAAGKEEAKNLGAFLRAEREKMKFSQEQIAQKMRLRRFVIEAIENEEWDRLPPPVFVRGFVRSYARTLELDEKKALELYRRTAPPEQDTLKSVAVARPSHRGRALIIIGALALVVCVFYYWHVKSTARAPGYPSMAERASPVQPEEIAPSADPGPAAPAEERVQGEALQPMVSAPAPEKVMPPEERVQGETLQPMVSAPAPEKVMPPEERVQEEALQPMVSAPETELQVPWLILKGEVKETTWVSISVDGNEPKEYMFQPGARPQWKGRKDFEIIIGNAGGMHLEFEGKSMENLGRPGQVIRLRLP